MIGYVYYPRVCKLPIGVETDILGIWVSTKPGSFGPWVKVSFNREDIDFSNGGRFLIKKCIIIELV